MVPWSLILVLLFAAETMQWEDDSYKGSVYVKEGGYDPYVHPPEFMPPDKEYDDYAHLNPYSVDNTLLVWCGNVTNKTMAITFRGQAKKVYDAKKHGCELIEMEPGHWQIKDAFGKWPIKNEYGYGDWDIKDGKDGNSWDGKDRKNGRNGKEIPDYDCEPYQNGYLEVYSVELIVQKSGFRTHKDPTYIVTCNYEKGGSSTSESYWTDDSYVAREALFNQVNTNKSLANFTMRVQDVKGYEIWTAYTGNYIQLKIKMTIIPGWEESFRPWNCKATSVDAWYQVYTHWFLLGGCGDGQIIRKDRGFFTTTEHENTTSVSKSVYFKAFSLANLKNITFECNFIIKNDYSLNGASCYNSPNFGRWKRSAESYSQVLSDGSVLDPEAPVMNSMMGLEKLPYISSALYLIVPKESPRWSNLPSWRDYINKPYKVRSRGRDVYMEPRSSSELSDEVKMGLVIGISVGSIFLITISTLAIYLSCRAIKRRNLPKYAGCHMQDMSPIVKYSAAPAKSHVASPPPEYHS